MKFSIPRITYALNEWAFGRDTFKYLNQLKKTQWLSAKELKALQFEKLKALLIHAYEDTGYYKDLFDKFEFSPYTMNRFEDFYHIPLLTKSDIRKNLPRIISKKYEKRLTRSVTSSSTGEPLIFYVSRQSVSANNAARLRSREWWDITIGDREVDLWGCRRDFCGYGMLRKARDLFLNTRLLPVFQHMNKEVFLRYIAFIKKYKPKHIFCYAHGMYVLAKFAKEQKIHMVDTGVKVIFVTAEVLHDFQKEVIEDTFGCMVVNEYGAKDGGFMACDCPGRSMHVSAENVFIECLNDNQEAKPGEKGEVVVTNLNSYGMPFIRYKVGDEAVWSERSGCNCGRSLPILKTIVGRDTDYIVTPRGDLLHAQALVFIFRELNSIDYFKIVQTGKDKFTIHIIKNDKYNSDTENNIKRNIENVIRCKVNVDFNYITGIRDIDRGDKYKFVQSKIIKDFLK
jgi:phenylacetate-CoA ligase